MIVKTHQHWTYVDRAVAVTSAMVEWSHRPDIRYQAAYNAWHETFYGCGRDTWQSRHYSGVAWPSSPAERRLVKALEALVSLSSGDCYAIDEIIEPMIAAIQGMLCYDTGRIDPGAVSAFLSQIRPITEENQEEH